MNLNTYPKISIIAFILALLEINSIISIGKLINDTLPCTQIPENSFPCYGIYDIGAFFILIAISLLSLTIYFILKKKTKRN